MTFLNPTFLWALLGIAVPIAIHLWSKKEGRTIRIGSTSLLRESDPKKTSSIKLNELWLLLLRMLAITVLVLILAEPQIRRYSENSRLTYLVEPSLLTYDEVNSILDTLPDNVEIKLLQKGFPDFDKEDFGQKNYSTPDYWKLSTEMEELPTDSIVVLTNAFVSGVKGKRPQIGKNVQWILLDPGELEHELVQAISKENEVKLIWIESDFKSLKFEKEILPEKSERIRFNPGNDSISVSAEGKEKQIELYPADSLSVLIVNNGNFGKETKYLQASYSAIANYLGRSVNVQVVNEENFVDPENHKTIVWLSDLPAPKTSGNILIFKQDSLANQIISEGTSAREYYLTTRLNSENIIEENFPEKLLMLLDLNKEIEEKIRQYDRRIMDPEELQPIYSAGLSGKSIAEIKDISKYLWMLLLILLLAERGLAYYRKQ